MDAARRIADQDGALCRVAVGQNQRQRIGPAWAGKLETAEVVAEPIRDLTEEARIVQGEHAFAQGIIQRPDDRAPIPGHRQPCKWAIGEEALHGDASVGLLVRHTADDAVWP